KRTAAKFFSSMKMLSRSLRASHPMKSAKLKSERSGSAGSAATSNCREQGVNSMEKQGSSKNEGSINPDAAPAAADLSGSGDFDSDTQSSEQQDAEATLDREIDDWGEQITAAYKKSVQDVIDLGKLLFKAKRALGHGNFRTMFDRGKVPFGQRTAEMLIAIAEHPMSNAKFISVLPQSWGTLYELTGLPEPELVSMLENGTINADTTREDVKEIFDELKKKGVYDFRQLIAAL